MPDSEKQHCPICGEEVTPISRYPNYVCDKCVKKATDQSGKGVFFTNRNLLGHECQSLYRETFENYGKNSCYIKGTKYKAQEAYFGGIVVQPV